MSRFLLYVKQTGEGGVAGSCPFCMRVYAFMLYKGLKQEMTPMPINLWNKPKSFLKLNPAGTTPVLVDQSAGVHVVPDSNLIVKYIEDLYPAPPTSLDYSGPAVEATANFFVKFVRLMRNTDAALSAQLRVDLDTELDRLERYFSQEVAADSKTGSRFLLGHELAEIDFAVTPKLLQVDVAGRHFKGIALRKAYPAIGAYLDHVTALGCFRETMPTEEEVVSGWAAHGAVKEV